MSNTLYDRDFAAWAFEQARLLRAGNVSEADIEHIAEEIESMGKAEKRELVSRLTVLLLHLLKWQFQPGRRGASWEISIANNRDQLEVHLSDNPSLRSGLPAALEQAYRYALREAVGETGLSRKTFPERVPWTFGQIMDADFWPEAA